MVRCARLRAESGHTAPPKRRCGAPTRAGPTDPARNRQRVPSQGTACTCTSTAGRQRSLGRQGRVRGHLGTLTWAPPPSGPGRPALSGRTSDPGRPGSTRPRSSASGCTSPASTGALQASCAALRAHPFSKQKNGLSFLPRFFWNSGERWKHVHIAATNGGDCHRSKLPQFWKLRAPLNFSLTSRGNRG